MKKSIIKYVGFYDLTNSKEDRVSSIPAVKKMEYITSAICRGGFSVNIISPSWMGKKTQKRVSKQKKINLNENVAITFTPSWKHKTKLGSKLKIIFSLIWLFFYLLFNTKKNEKIIVYHAQWLSLPIRIAKRIRKFQVVLEVEEIYSEVWENSWLLNKWEDNLLSNADYYIFVSDKLKKRFSQNNRESIVLYGAYESENNKKELKHNDSYIHLVYAGSIDHIKGGAFNSLEVMKKLPNKYKLHILGGGKSHSIEELNNKISKINARKGYESIIYNGILHGEEFTNYLLKCDIALNLQHQGEYMNTAFPSKVITYLSHNLKVISTPIESIMMSRVSQYIHFSKSDEPEDFIETIIKTELSDTKKYSNIINDLDIEFVFNLKKLLLN